MADAKDVETSWRIHEQMVNAIYTYDITLLLFEEVCKETCLKLMFEKLQNLIVILKSLWRYLEFRTWCS